MGLVRCEKPDFQETLKMPKLFVLLCEKTIVGNFANLANCSCVQNTLLQTNASYSFRDFPYQLNGSTSPT